MNPADVLYCVVCADESADRGAGAELLSAFEYDMSSWKDEESGSIHHTVYFQDRASAEKALAKSYPMASAIFLDISVFPVPYPPMSRRLSIIFPPVFAAA